MGGNAEGFYVVYAIGAGSLVEVTGDAISTGSDGAGVLAAYHGGTIRVSGNATASGDFCVGVVAYELGSTVSVGGSVTARRHGRRGRICLRRRSGDHRAAR